ncbi:MAG: ABC transporter ATP-binding protein [Clostridium sp.]|nr:ABC transporter ATP-binding protein [Clostridium sp.]
MLVIKDLKKTFENHNQKVNVLNGISLHIHKGDMVGIMGPSGSGKSTLLHIMGCLDKPSDGTYQIEGTDVAFLSDSQAARLRNKKFGFVHQNFMLLEEESVLENVSIPLLFSDKSLKYIDKIALETLDRLNMIKYIDKKVCTLSSGEKQRVAIARAMVNQPDIILADEPTGALDKSNTEQIMECFKRLNEDGKTVVVITHDMQVASYCRQRYDIIDGKLYKGK